VLHLWGISLRYEQYKMDENKINDHPSFGNNKKFILSLKKNLNIAGEENDLNTPKKEVRQNLKQLKC
jgi:hypothetical protein